jgi:uncharacterized protein involved in outer membrane biogenesis
MRRKLLVGIGLLLILALLAGVAVLLWLRSDGLRQTLEAQATAALGAPVRIGSARATLFPRLGFELVDVTAGEPPHGRVDRASIATGLGVLWSRRVEAADLQLSGGELRTSSLAALLTAAGSLPGLATSSETESPLTIDSIRSIRVRDLVVASETQRIPIDCDASLDHDRLTVTDAEVSIGDSTLHITGEMTSLERREGHVELRADVLPVAPLIAAVTDLLSSDGAGTAAPNPASPTPYRLTVSITAPTAIVGTRRTDTFAARLEATSSAIVLDPVTFTLDAGRFEMRVAVDASDRSAPIETRGTVTGLDVAQLQAATSTRRQKLTGRLDATFTLRAPPRADVFAMLEEASGSVDLAIRNGHMPGIQVVRQTVLRLANRAGPPPSLEATDAFSRLDASLSLQPSAARISRLTLTAADFDVEGHGALSPRDWRMALDATVTLTEALSQQAGRDLYRYAHDGKRIVLPIVIGGTLFEPTATIDVSKAAGRAINNRIEDEVQSLFERLIKKRPKD